MTARKYYLDNLKVMLTVLVVFHHASLAYSPFSDWVYSPSNAAETMPWIWHFNSVNAAFFMGLFFLISGYFVPRSYDKQGAGKFCRKKLLRLGLPTLIVSVILTVLTKQLEVGHLWFLEGLLLFCLLYALVRQFVRPVGQNCHSRISLPLLLAVAIVMGAGGWLIRRASPQDNWIWLLGFIHIEPAHYLQYVMMFILGILAYRFEWLEKMKDSTGIAALAIGLALAAGNYLRGGGAWNAFVTQWFGIYESFLCVFLSFGLIWLFREYGNWSGKFWRWCSAQAYGVYIVHLFVLLGIQYATDELNMPVAAKFLLIGTLATAASFLITWAARQLYPTRVTRGGTKRGPGRQRRELPEHKISHHPLEDQKADG